MLCVLREGGWNEDAQSKGSCWGHIPDHLPVVGVFDGWEKAEGVAWTGAWMLSRLATVGWSASSEESLARIQLGLDLAQHSTQMTQTCLKDTDTASRTEFTR